MNSNWYEIHDTREAAEPRSHRPAPQAPSGKNTGITIRV